MGAKVICLASPKGGAGKTMVAASIATFLAAIGKRVLLIDVDAATNGLSLLYLREVAGAANNPKDFAGTPRGLFEIDPDFNAPIVPDFVPIGERLHLVPATFTYGDSERLPARAVRENLLNALREYWDKYDYILLDAEAGADHNSLVAMSREISNDVVIVTEFDPMSSAGIERLKSIAGSDLSHHRTWILVNKIIPDFAKNLGDFATVSRYLSPLPWDVDVVRAYARRRLALDLEVGNQFTVALIETVRSLLAGEIDDELDAWLDKKSTLLKTPIADRRVMLLQELGALKAAKEAKARRDIQRRRVRNVALSAAISIAAVLATAVASRGFGLSLDKIGSLAIVLGPTIIVAGFVTQFGLELLERNADREGPSFLEPWEFRSKIEAIEKEIGSLDTLLSATPEELMLRQRK